MDHSFSSLIKQQFQEAQTVLTTFLTEEKNTEAIAQAALLMSKALRQGDKVISCGNGGSHCDAMHFAEELTGRFRKDRPALAAIAISDTSHITCTGNDYGFSFIFSRFVEGLGRPGDILLAISTSGNSENILQAARAAREREMKVVALTGNGGGQLAALADVEIRVSHVGHADRIQEVHIKIIHILVLLIEQQVLIPPLI
ncbi:phosphoheptose isomerase [Adhaeribacter aerolatus]|uniref:Phosphoheptose isomerase n=1 Tax=Adhaeribacter aerolatus TaxID=670289 RepID=A0A512B0M1_9BACT|nr:D-sedoheptulose 7-phosphate isomerase [Adhaeribacter aerolatus]GEO05492.1 phosphoheptose isomerase [Adhaeribacter aerolatus]